MEKLVGLVGMFAGSAIGGWIGGKFGLMWMMVLSAIGAGVGFYFGRKVVRDYLD